MNQYHIGMTLLSADRAGFISTEMEDNVMMLVRCYTCNLVFDIDKRNEKEEAIKHSRACHEMTLGFRA